MESVFEKLEKAQAGEDRSPAWWRQAGKVAMRSALADGTKDAIVTNEIVNRDDDNEVKFTPKIGQLMMFEYNARVSKQVLPFYDQLTVVLVLQVKQDHFWAANLHYISPKKRLKTIEGFIERQD